MRFTLRTVLAYLDDTLESSQTRELGHRINKSESAKAIIDRIKTVMRRRRLLAPDAAPALATIDANDVAEYVDNVGSGEQLAKTERRILESDMHLAEVAVSHQLAALGLTTLADPSERLRRRSERILSDAGVTPQRVRRSHGVPLERFGGYPAAAEETSLPVSIPRIVANPSFQSRATLVGVIGILAAMLALLVSRTVSGPNRERSLDVGANARLAVEAANANAIGRNEVDRDSSKKAVDANPVAADGKPTATPPAKSLTKSAGTIPATGQRAGAAKSQLDAANSKNEPKPNAPAPILAAANPSKNDSIAPEVKSEPAKADLEKATAKPPETAKAPAPQAGLATAKYVSPTGLLFRRSGENAIRMISEKQSVDAGEPAEEAIRTRDEILQPDGFRSTIEVSNRGLVDVVDQTKLSIPNESSALAGADFAFGFAEGRLVVRTAEKPVVLKVGFQDAVYRISVSGNKSKASLERRIESPGSSVAEAQASARLLIVGAYRGEVSVAVEGEPEETKIAAGTELLIRPGMKFESRPTEKPPTWLEANETSADARAAERFASLLQFGDQAVAGLREKLIDGSRENRRFAVKGLAAVERVDLLAEALRSEFVEVRVLAASALRQYVCENAARLEPLRESLVSAYAVDDGDTLLDLIAGYPPASLATSEIFERLLALLESPQLAVRELALFNLRDLTGKTLGFDANAKDGQRRLAVNQWKRWLAGQQNFPPKRSAVSR